MTTLESDDERFTPAEHLNSDLGSMAMGWAELGIDADDFLKCPQCHKFFEDLVEGTEPPVRPDELCTCPED